MLLGGGGPSGRSLHGSRPTRNPGRSRRMVRRALVSVHGKTGVVKFCRGLAARVLEQEHQLYPRAIRLYAEGRLQMVGRRVLVREGP